MAFGKAIHENSVPKVASLKRSQWSMKTQDLPDQQREQQTSSLSTLQGFGIVRRGRGSKRRGSQFRFFVLGLADVSLHLITQSAGSRLPSGDDISVLMCVAAANGARLLCSRPYESCRSRD